MSGIFQKIHSRMPGQSPSQYLGFPSTSESPPPKGFDSSLEVPRPISRCQRLLTSDSHDSTLVLTASPATPIYMDFLGSSASVSDWFNPLEDFSFYFSPT